MKINADRGKVFRRKNDGVIMGATIVLGIDYSTGVARTDLSDYYEQINNPVKQIVIETYIAEHELETVKTNFPEWTPGEKVWAKDGDKPADMRQYKAQLYKCVQSHTTQADWTPNITPALWVKVAAPAEIPVWKQPAGAHDSYQKGDKVYFPTANDSVFESLIANNVWSPTAYPAGWKKL